MKTRITFVLLALALCASANAEVYKCKSPDGKTLYADEPCGKNGKVLSNLGANTLPAIPLPAQEHQAGNMPPRQQPTDVQTPAAPAPFVADAYSCNLARRNAETTASSAHADPKRVELAEREANIACFGTAKAGEIEQARAAAPKVVVKTVATRVVQQPPRFITHCAGAYCYDNLGGRHLRPRP